MNDILKELEESRAVLKRLMKSPAISVVEENRTQAEKLKESLARISTRIQDYNELQSLDKMIDDIADNLEKE
jgi:shikimate 5-dehydrogenase